MFIKKRISVSELISARGKEFDLRLLEGREGLNREVTHPEVQRLAASFLTGGTRLSPGQIQVVDREEVQFLKKMSVKSRKTVLEKLPWKRIPCIILTGNSIPPKELLEIARRRKIPTLQTRVRFSSFSSQISAFLEEKFSPSISLSGVMVEVYGLGILILGVTGIGKSECALELVSRGHRLIAGEVVGIRQRAGNVLVGFAKEPVRYYLELRGLGIVDVERLFGAGAVRNSAKIDLVVKLEEWDRNKEYELLGLEEKYTNILGVKVPEVVIPVRSGRNIAIIIEVAAMEHRLRRQGYHAVTELDRRAIELIKKK